MTRTRIKICGVTRPEDALAAAEAGADSVGLVFHTPAKRNVTLARARQILDVLPPFVTPVGLFVNAEPAAVLQVTRELRLRHVQLHGAELPAAVAELQGLAVIKAVHVEAERFGHTLGVWRDAVRSPGLPMLRGIVLETPSGVSGGAGGTGVPNDWETVCRYIADGAFAGLPPLIAAGGLRPETVGDVVRRVRPWAVDVSSGVEDEPGKKSVRRIREFIHAVREVDAESTGPAIAR